MSSTLRPPLWARPFSSLPKGCERVLCRVSTDLRLYGFSDSVLCTILGLCWEGESALMSSMLFQ